MTDLKSILFWLASGPGSGIATFFIMTKITWPANIGSEYKRYISIAMSTAIAWAAWFVLVFASQTPAPVGLWSWLEALAAIAGTAYLVNQGLHGAVTLAAQDEVVRVANLQAKTMDGQNAASIDSRYAK